MSDHTSFTKKNGNGGILIVSLYVDDLLFIGNNEQLFQEFKSSMMAELDMSDLGYMSYFLGVEITQS